MHLQPPSCCILTVGPDSTGVGYRKYTPARSGSRSHTGWHAASPLCRCVVAETCSPLYPATIQVTTPECAIGQEAGCYISLALFDVKWNSQFNALLNIMRTLFIVVALAAATLLFNRDSDRLVLRPIERMIKKASRMLPAPLAVTGQAKVSCGCTPLAGVLQTMTMPGSHGDANPA